MKSGSVTAKEIRTGSTDGTDIPVAIKHISFADQSNIDINDVKSESVPEPIKIEESLNVGGSSNSKYGQGRSGLKEPDGLVSFSFEVSET